MLAVGGLRHKNNIKRSQLGILDTLVKPELILNLFFFGLILVIGKDRR